MRGLLLAIAVLAVAGCGGGGDGGGAAVTRDSAGIAIVENAGPVWSAGQEWKVDSVILDIGGDVDSVSGPVRLGDGRLAIANAGTHEVRVYDASGAQVHASGRAKTQLTARIEQAKYSATLPFVGSLLVDSEGHLWAQEVPPPSIERTTYAVFDESGRLLGRVIMPNDFRASSIGADAVYGVWKDADDVEHVRAYRLRKAS